MTGLWQTLQSVCLCNDARVDRLTLELQIDDCSHSVCHWCHSLRTLVPGQQQQGWNCNPAQSTSNQLMSKGPTTMHCGSPQRLSDSQSGCRIFSWKLVVSTSIFSADAILNVHLWMHQCTASMSWKKLTGVRRGGLLVGVHGGDTNSSLLMLPCNAKWWIQSWLIQRLKGCWELLAQLTLLIISVHLDTVGNCLLNLMPNNLLLICELGLQSANLLFPALCKLGFISFGPRDNLLMNKSHFLCVRPLNSQSSNWLWQFNTFNSVTLQWGNQLWFLQLVNWNINSSEDPVLDTAPLLQGGRILLQLDSFSPHRLSRCHLWKRLCEWHGIHKMSKEGHLGWTCHVCKCQLKLPGKRCCHWLNFNHLLFQNHLWQTFGSFDATTVKGAAPSAFQQALFPDAETSLLKASSWSPISVTRSLPPKTSKLMTSWVEMIVFLTWSVSSVSFHRLDPWADLNCPRLTSVACCCSSLWRKSWQQTDGWKCEESMFWLTHPKESCGIWNHWLQLKATTSKDPKSLHVKMSWSSISLQAGMQELWETHRWMECHNKQVCTFGMTQRLGVSAASGKNSRTLVVMHFLNSSSSIPAVAFAPMVIGHHLQVWSPFSSPCPKEALTFFVNSNICQWWSSVAKGSWCKPHSGQSLCLAVILCPSWAHCETKMSAQRATLKVRTLNFAQKIKVCAASTQSVPQRTRIFFCTIQHEEHCFACVTLCQNESCKHWKMSLDQVTEAKQQISCQKTTQSSPNQSNTWNFMCFVCWWVNNDVDCVDSLLQFHFLRALSPFFAKLNFGGFAKPEPLQSAFFVPMKSCNFHATSRVDKGQTFVFLKIWWSWAQNTSQIATGPCSGVTGRLVLGPFDESLIVAACRNWTCASSVGNFSHCASHAAVWWKSTQGVSLPSLCLDKTNSQVCLAFGCTFASKSTHPCKSVGEDFPSFGQIGLAFEWCDPTWCLLKKSATVIPGAHLMLTSLTLSFGHRCLQLWPLLLFRLTMPWTKPLAVTLSVSIQVGSCGCLSFLRQSLIGINSWAFTWRVSFPLLLHFPSHLWSLCTRHELLHWTECGSLSQDRCDLQCSSWLLSWCKRRHLTGLLKSSHQLWSELLELDHMQHTWVHIEVPSQVDWVPWDILQARSLGACDGMSSTAQAMKRNLPMTCRMSLICWGSMADWLFVIFNTLNFCATVDGGRFWWLFVTLLGFDCLRHTSWPVPATQWWGHCEAWFCVPWPSALKNCLHPSLKDGIHTLTFALLLVLQSCKHSMEFLKILSLILVISLCIHMCSALSEQQQKQQKNKKTVNAPSPKKPGRSTMKFRKFLLLPSLRIPLLRQPCQTLWLARSLCPSSAWTQGKRPSWPMQTAHSSSQSLAFHPTTSPLIAWGSSVEGIDPWSWEQRQQSQVCPWHHQCKNQSWCHDQEEIRGGSKESSCQIELQLTLQCDVCWQHQKRCCHLRWMYHCSGTNCRHQRRRGPAQKDLCWMQQPREAQPTCNIHTAWTFAKRTGLSPRRLSLGNNQSWSSRSHWSSTNVAWTIGRNLEITESSKMEKKPRFHLRSLQVQINRSNICMNLSINSPMSFWEGHWSTTKRRLLRECWFWGRGIDSAMKKRVQLKQETIHVLQKHSNLEKRGEALSNQLSACLDCRLNPHRKALDDAEDRRMELFREARKRKKLSHEGVNERHLKCKRKCEQCPQPQINGIDDVSVDSLDSIFHQIARQDWNIIENKDRPELARWDAQSLKWCTCIQCWHWISHLNHNPSVLSLASDCSSSSWFLIKLSMGRSSWCDMISPRMNFLLVSSTTMPPKASVGSVFEQPLLHCNTPGVFELIGWTSKSVGDQRSLECDLPSSSMTKLCNLAAAPQMSLRHSRWTPMGVLKICHLVVSNPNTISRRILSWLRWKENELLTALMNCLILWCATTGMETQTLTLYPLVSVHQDVKGPLQWQVLEEWAHQHKPVNVHLPLREVQGWSQVSWMIQQCVANTSPEFAHAKISIPIEKNLNPWPLLALMHLVCQHNWENWHWKCPTTCSFTWWMQPMHLLKELQRSLSMKCAVKCSENCMSPAGTHAQNALCWNITFLSPWAHWRLRGLMTKTYHITGRQSAGVLRSWKRAKGLQPAVKACGTLRGVGTGVWVFWSLKCGFHCLCHSPGETSSFWFLNSFHAVQWLVVWRSGNPLWDPSLLAAGTTTTMESALTDAEVLIEDKPGGESTTKSGEMEKWTIDGPSGAAATAKTDMSVNWFNTSKEQIWLHNREHLCQAKHPSIQMLDCNSRESGFDWFWWVWGSQVHDVTIWQASEQGGRGVIPMKENRWSTLASSHSLERMMQQASLLPSRVENLIRCHQFQPQNQAVPKSCWARVDKIGVWLRCWRQDSSLQRNPSANEIAQMNFQKNPILLTFSFQTKRELFWCKLRTSLSCRNLWQHFLQTTDSKNKHQGFIPHSFPHLSLLVVWSKNLLWCVFFLHFPAKNELDFLLKNSSNLKSHWSDQTLTALKKTSWQLTKDIESFIEFKFCETTQNFTQTPFSGFMRMSQCMHIANLLMFLHIVTETWPMTLANRQLRVDATFSCFFSLVTCSSTLARSWMDAIALHWMCTHNDLCVAWPSHALCCTWRNVHHLLFCVQPHQSAHSDKRNTSCICTDWVQHFAWTLASVKAWGSHQMNKWAPWVFGQQKALASFTLVWSCLCSGQWSWVKCDTEFNRWMGAWVLWKSNQIFLQHELLWNLQPLVSLSIQLSDKGHSLLIQSLEMDFELLHGFPPTVEEKWWLRQGWWAWVGCRPFTQAQLNQRCSCWSPCPSNCLTEGAAFQFSPWRQILIHHMGFCLLWKKINSAPQVAGFWWWMRPHSPTQLSQRCSRGRPGGFDHPKRVTAGFSIKCKWILSHSENVLTSSRRKAVAAPRLVGLVGRQDPILQPNCTEGLHVDTPVCLIARKTQQSQSSLNEDRFEAIWKLSTTSGNGSTGHTVSGGAHTSIGRAKNGCVQRPMKRTQNQPKMHKQGIHSTDVGVVVTVVRHCWKRSHLVWFVNAWSLMQIQQEMLSFWCNSSGTSGNLKKSMCWLFHKKMQWKKMKKICRELNQEKVKNVMTVTLPVSDCWENWDLCKPHANQCVSETGLNHKMWLKISISHSQTCNIPFNGWTFEKGGVHKNLTPTPMCNFEKQHWCTNSSAVNSAAMHSDVQWSQQQCQFPHKLEMITCDCTWFSRAQEVPMWQCHWTAPISTAGIEPHPNTEDIMRQTDFFWISWKNMNNCSVCTRSGVSGCTSASLPTNGTSGSCWGGFQLPNFDRSAFDNSFDSITPRWHPAFADPFPLMTSFPVFSNDSKFATDWNRTHVPPEKLAISAQSLLTHHALDVILPPQKGSVSSLTARLPPESLVVTFHCIDSSWNGFVFAVTQPKPSIPQIWCLLDLREFMTKINNCLINPHSSLLLLKKFDGIDRCFDSWQFHTTTGSIWTSLRGSSSGKCRGKWLKEFTQLFLRLTFPFCRQPVDDRLDVVLLGTNPMKIHSIKAIRLISVDRIAVVALNSEPQKWHNFVRAFSAPTLSQNTIARVPIKSARWELSRLFIPGNCGKPPFIQMHVWMLSTPRFLSKSFSKFSTQAERVKTCAWTHWNRQNSSVEQDFARWNQKTLEKSDFFFRLRIADFSAVQKTRSNCALFSQIHVWQQKTRCFHEAMRNSFKKILSKLGNGERKAPNWSELGRASHGFASGSHCRWFTSRTNPSQKWFFFFWHTLCSNFCGVMSVQTFATCAASLTLRLSHRCSQLHHQKSLLSSRRVWRDAPHKLWAPDDAKVHGFESHLSEGGTFQCTNHSANLNREWFTSVRKWITQRGNRSCNSMCLITGGTTWSPAIWMQAKQHNLMLKKKSGILSVKMILNTVTKWTAKQHQNVWMNNTKLTLTLKSCSLKGLWGRSMKRTTTPLSSTQKLINLSGKKLTSLLTIPLVEELFNPSHGQAMKMNNSLLRWLQKKGQCSRTGTDKSNTTKSFAGVSLSLETTKKASSNGRLQGWMTTWLRQWEIHKFNLNQGHTNLWKVNSHCQATLLFPMALLLPECSVETDHSRIVSQPEISLLLLNPQRMQSHVIKSETCPDVCALRTTGITRSVLMQEKNHDTEHLSTEESFLSWKMHTVGDGKILLTLANGSLQMRVGLLVGANQARQLDLNQNLSGPEQLCTPFASAKAVFSHVNSVLGLMEERAMQSWEIQHVSQKWTFVSAARCCIDARETDTVSAWIQPACRMEWRWWEGKSGKSTWLVLVKQMEPEQENWQSPMSRCCQQTRTSHSSVSTRRSPCRTRCGPTTTLQRHSLTSTLLSLNWEGSFGSRKTMTEVEKQSKHQPTLLDNRRSAARTSIGLTKGMQMKQSSSWTASQKHMAGLQKWHVGCSVWQWTMLSKCVNTFALKRIKCHLTWGTMFESWLHLCWMKDHQWGDERQATDQRWLQQDHHREERFNQMREICLHHLHEGGVILRHQVEVQERQMQHQEGQLCSIRRESLIKWLQRNPGEVTNPQQPSVRRKEVIATAKTARGRGWAKQKDHEDAKQHTDVINAALNSGRQFGCATHWRQEETAQAMKLRVRGWLSCATWNTTLRCQNTQQMMKQFNHLNGPSQPL